MAVVIFVISFDDYEQKPKGLRKWEMWTGRNQSVTTVGVLASFECGPLHHFTVYMSLWSTPQQHGFIEMHAVVPCEYQGETQGIK